VEQETTCLDHRTAPRNVGIVLRSFGDGTFFGEMYGSEMPRALALHGWRRTRDDFRDVLDGLDAVALDLPGFGSSPPPPEPWGSADYANALTPVLTELKLPAVVLGHSFGGRVAVHLAATNPDAVAALVLTGVPNLVRRDRGGARPPLPFRVGRALHRRGLIGDARMEALRQKHGSEDYRAAEGVMRDVLVRVVNESYEDQLRQIRCPVELVWGEHDTAAPVDGMRRAADLLGDARVTVVPCDHHTPVHEPAALRAAVERHL
jgi:pimeloyl-ACP methyl ester carboxylesterase